MRFPKPKTPRDKKYLRWLTTLPCAFCGRPGPSEPSHHGPRGMGIKASDYLALPSCHDCHMRWHSKLRSPHVSWDGLSKDEKADQLQLLARELRSVYTGSATG